jgi:D-alanine-D-alanine ligase
MRRKLRVGVLFGGRSSEHEVSLVSAASVLKALDREKYEVVPIGITKEGGWLSSPQALRMLKANLGAKAIEERIILPDPAHRGLVALRNRPGRAAPRPLDVVFPVLHGPLGEDGTVQGLLELADLPYVGAGVLASAVGMDKVIQKHLFEQQGLPTPRWLHFSLPEYRRNPESLERRIDREIGYPCFVKPANAGSSVGIGKALSRAQLDRLIRAAGRYDLKILVEEAVPQAREIEVSVLGNDRPRASVPGEIIPCNEFYDYDAKYVNGKSVTVAPAALPQPVTRKIRQMAIKAYEAIDCSGMARVDFLVTRKKYKIYLSELNTIPGFTPISMYPRLWEASGLPYPRLLDELIRLALQRHRARRKLMTSYRPRMAWYR